MPHDGLPVDVPDHRPATGPKAPVDFAECFGCPLDVLEHLNAQGPIEGLVLNGQRENVTLFERDIVMPLTPKPSQTQHRLGSIDSNYATVGPDFLGDFETVET